MSQQGNLNTWFQEEQPSSYKIQIMYVDIPKHMILDKKSVDTPFRFRNFEEATQKCTEMGARLFEPQTLRQNNAVYALLKAKGRDQHNHWIGIHDQLEENK